MSGSSGADLVAAYISRFPEPVREQLEAFRTLIRECAPEAEERMAYGIPTFWLKGNLVHFAAFKNHIGFYPTPSALEAFQEELRPYETSAGTVRFPLKEPVPWDLVRRMVMYRVRENTATE